MDGTLHITGTDKGVLPGPFEGRYELVRSGSGLSLTSSVAQTEQACRWVAPSPEGTSIGVLLRGRIGFGIGGREQEQFSSSEGFLFASRKPVESYHNVEAPSEYRTIFLNLPDAAAELLRLSCEGCETMKSMLSDRGGGPKLRRWIPSRGVLALAHQVAVCPYTGPLRTLYLQGKALELLTLMLTCVDQTRATPDYASRPSSAHTERLMAARGVLLAEFAAPPSLDDLARRVGMSTSSLTAGFRQAFGCSIMKFVQQQRMNHAFQALTDGRINVSQAAYGVGYSRAHFSSLFRRRFGISPKSLTQGDP